MKYLLRLYTTGQTPNSTRALANINRICAEELNAEYEIEVIDILKNPQLAEDDKIIATPTLVKKLPSPLRRLVGDLSNRDKVLLGLDIIEPKSKTAPCGVEDKLLNQKETFHNMEAKS
jgi:circadian clock protein KaiB